MGVTAKTTDQERAEINQVCNDFVKACVDADVRARVDARDNYSPGWKFNHWELKVSSFFLISNLHFRQKPIVDFIASKFCLELTIFL